MLAATIETEALVADLAYTIERQQKLARRKVTREHRKEGSDNQLDNQSELSNPTPLTLSSSDIFNRWYSTYVGQDKHRLEGWGDEFLDEISIFLEQVRAHRGE